MQTLFENIRRACAPGTWSRGVEIARRDAVVGVESDASEVVLRVSTRGGLVAPTVRLYPEDGEWDCDCRSPEDPCDHVAAAVISLRRAAEGGAALPGAETAPGRVGYRFTRDGKALDFSRSIVTGDREVPLRASLAAISSGRVDGPEFIAGAADLEVEEVLGHRLRGPIPRPLLARLLHALASCEDVRLGDQSISTSNDEVLPIAVLRDHGEGFELRLRRDPAVTEMFRGGLALCGDVLRPSGQARLSHREQRELLDGRYFAPEEVSRLVSEVLPSLSQRLHVEVRTKRLPDTQVGPPRLRIEVERRGDGLRVLPSLVYGAGPNSRVDGEKLVHLSGAVPLRDEAAERRLIVQLRRDLELAPGWPATLSPTEAIELNERLKGFDGEVVGRDHEQFFDAGALEPRLDLDPDHFDLAFEASHKGARRRADPAAVLRAWQAGQPLVPLLDGGFATPPDAWLKQHASRVADLVAARGEGGALPTCALPDLAKLCADLGEPPPAGLDRLRALLEGFDGLPEAELPGDLSAELRPYQRRGVSWLAFLRDAGLGALLADDMGLGKTIQALCALRGRSLVVCPTSVLYVWADEIRRFRPGLRCAVYHGSKRELDPQADVTLTTYALLRLDAERLLRETWDTAILDEAQAIKNPASQSARAAYALRADFRLTLTGTPIENRLEELWSQLHFSNPALLGRQDDFRSRYVRPILEGETGAAARLRDRIRPFVLRRLKQEVAPELPPRTEGVLHCELAPSERAVYDAVRAASREDVVARLRAGGSVLEALEVLLRLRQAACHPSLVPGQNAEISSKVEVLLEVLDEVVAERHKALVFSQWTSLLDLLEPHLRAAELPFLRLDGSTRDRGRVVEGFQDADGPPLLLISLRAGGTGLNLTAADHVFLLDPWWNPAVEDQAADRTHRIGQDRPVSVYRLVARDTVEERILLLQARKRELADAALGEADRATSITRDELLALLE
jgi:superfamily II DNA or RNA helicase